MPRSSASKALKWRLTRSSTALPHGPLMRSSESTDNPSHELIAAFMRLVLAPYGVLRGTSRPLCLLREFVCEQWPSRLD